MSGSEEARSRSSDIAIVGIGCRYPGNVHGPDAFWSFLTEGRDGICEVPEDRWSLAAHYDATPDRPGKTYVRRGAFLTDWSPYEFDAGFFGISAREAASMDPQQRLMLELSWEALEDARIPADSLAGQAVGVFLGCFTLDNKISQMSPLNRQLISPHTATSSSMAILSNRISYVFDFKGPSFTLDTACSSSLVALHYAVRSLAAGDCSMALVGGVNVMMRPEYAMIMGAGHYLSADGQCKSFDSRANGYGRGEGGGMLVLKPLSDARRDGDRVYAVIAGTGVNQDGRTDGMSVPNGAAQEELMASVMAEAGIAPDAISYVEAHGTGTPVGDPIECSAIGARIGKAAGRDGACLVGSVKSAIGHQEAGAGVAGTIKAALSLYNQAVLPQAGLQELNPAIPFEALGLEIPRALTPLQGRETPHYAAINSFGYGGTNAHALLRQADTAYADTTVAQERASAAMPGEQVLLPLSARDPDALRDAARQMAEVIETASPDRLGDICWTAATRRAHLDHRLVAEGRNGADIAAALIGFAEAGSDPGIAQNRVIPSAAGEDVTRPVFVFSGMGPQWWGMGRELIADDTQFRDIAEACDASFASLSGWSLLAEMAKDEANSSMSDTRVAQPSNVLLQIALTDWLARHGVTPAAVVGHSVGEISAGYAAGLLTRDQAMTVAYHRSQIQYRTAGEGTMLAVGSAHDEAETLVNGFSHDVAIAAVNAPESVTLAGRHEHLQQIAARLESEERFNRFLNVEIAYHSPQMEALEPAIRDALADLQPGSPMLPLYSTVTGDRITGPSHDAGYWYANVRQTVRFMDAMNALLADGHRHFLEVGPHPVLSPSIKACVAASGQRAAIVATLRRKTAEHDALTRALSELHVAGCDLDWPRLVPSGRAVDLPTYPFQRQRHWEESPVSRADRLGHDGHPLLGHPLDGPEQAFTTELGTTPHPWLHDHVVDGAIVLPGAAYVEIGLALQQRRDRSENVIIEDLKFERGLVIDPAEMPVLRTEVDDNGRDFAVFSRDLLKPEASWQRHARGRISDATAERPGAFDLDQLRSHAVAEIAASEIYGQLSALGLDYGESFRPVRSLLKLPHAVLAEIESGTSSVDNAYVLHPALLDGCFQTLISAVDAGDADRVFVPAAIRQLRLHAPLPDRFVCLSSLSEQSPNAISGDLVLMDENGEVVAEVRGLRCQALERAGARRSDWRDWLYDIDWQQEDPTGRDLQAHGNWLVIGGAPDAANALAAVVADAGGQPEHLPLDAVATLGAHLRSSPADVIVFLAPSESANDPAGIAATSSLLETLKAVIASDMPVPRIGLVTTGGVSIARDDAPRSPEQAALIGLLRVLSSEHPELDPVAVDAAQDTGAVDWRSVIDDIVSDSEEREIVWRDGTRFVPRVRRAEHTGDVAPEPVRRTLGSGPVALGFDRPGQLDGLTWREAEETELGPNDVEMRVEAASINFKDVLKVLGMLDPQAIEGTYHTDTIGMEVAAEVIRVGQDVTTLKPGDAIVAQPHGGFRSVIVENENDFFWMPRLQGVSPAANASLIVVFVTANYALRDLARLEAGERVLIHAAAGGVGQAAVQIAREMGAEIYATAGTEEKRQLLREQGCQHVYASRTLDFAEAIRRDTAGEGVDVVLNSLAGEAAIASLELLRPHGRFVEIGKRDFVSETRFSMAPFNRGLSYFALDLDRMMLSRPERHRRMLREVWDLFESGRLTAEEPQTLPADRAVDGFRILSQSQNVGKVVIGFDSETEIEVMPRAAETAADIHGDKTYLVTGGYSGLGLVTARMLGGLGARHLALVGRRGIETPGAQEAVAALVDSGCTVENFSLDISDEAGVTTMFADIAARMPPLAGIFHAAGVLDDGLMTGQTPERITRVMEPKALGVRHLDRCSRNLALDHFVVFSSISAIVGNAGQAGYAAANAVSDVVMQQRRALGLPGLSINWGPVSDVGMAASNPAVVAHFDTLGLYSITPDDVASTLSQLLSSEAAQVIVGNVGWSQWALAAPRKAREPSFRDIVQSESSDESSSLVRELEGLDFDERKQRASHLMADIVASTLRIGREQVDLEKPLADIGLDSLMTVELQTGLASTFGVEFSTMELMRGAGIGEMALVALKRLKLGGDQAS